MEAKISRELDQRFEVFLARLDKISRSRPREECLYEIMRGVPFNDLEVALMMVDGKDHPERC